MQPKINYSYQLSIRDLNYNKSWQGVAVLPFANRYDLEIDARGDVDLLTFTTAHRQKVFELTRVDSRKRIKILYVPTANIEQVDLHTAYLEAFDRDEGKHSFGLIAFQNPFLLDKATLYCNGEKAQLLGTSACQSKAGLLQGIEFDREMRIITSPECAQKDNGPAKSFEIKLPTGHCQFTFVGGDQKAGHELVTYGWDKIAI